MGRKFIAAFGMALLALDAHAQTPTEKARTGRIVWSAFQCATYAEMAGNPKEQSRLFDLGVRAGRSFLEAFKGPGMPEEVQREVPIGVLMLLQGPSPDFIVGRIFENAMRDAYDDIVTRDNNGIPLDASKHLQDPQLRKSKAQNKYLRANCALLK
jgi:hypothetical protein